MGKIIFCTRLFLLMWLLFSCGTNHFAKRKYTKGVYIEKRSQGVVVYSKKNLTKERAQLILPSIPEGENIKSPLNQNNNQQYDEIEEFEIAFRKDIIPKENQEIPRLVDYQKKKLKEETQTIEEIESKSKANSDKSKPKITGIIFTSIGAVLIFIGIFIMIFLSILFQGFILILGGLVIVIGLIFLIDGLVKLTRPKKE